MKATLALTCLGDEGCNVTVRLRAPISSNEIGFYAAGPATHARVQHLAPSHRCAAFISPPDPKCMVSVPVLDGVSVLACAKRASITLAACAPGVRRASSALRAG
ncbi:MAG TPA: hypothetical protein PKK06_18400 [Phycisphaerae bacterium]|nr:hypothetical protein [Phycisphaerae bacterium]